MQVAIDPQFETDFRRWLQNQLTERCKKNPRYSLRAFALLLTMDASSVAQILSGKRNASTKVITIICDRLSTDPRQTEVFLNLAARKRRAPIDVMESTSYEMFTRDAFAVISDWVHFAIIALTQAEGFEYSAGRVARALGITAAQVQIAVERLIRLNILKMDGHRLTSTNKFFTNIEPGLTSAAHKTLQRQLLEKALEAIDNCPKEDKDITTMTMTIDPRKIDDARKRIMRFRRELCAFLEDGEQTRVFNLGVQLYPLSTDLKADNLNPETANDISQEEIA